MSFIERITTNMAAIDVYLIMNDDIEYLGREITL